MKKWILITNNADGDFALQYFEGTKADAKRALMELIREDKKENRDDWEQGTSAVKELDEEDGLITGFNDFYGCSVNYTAYPMNMMPEYCLRAKKKEVA